MTHRQDTTTQMTDLQTVVGMVQLRFNFKSKNVFIVVISHFSIVRQTGDEKLLQPDPHFSQPERQAAPATSQKSLILLKQMLARCYQLGGSLHIVFAMLDMVRNNWPDSYPDLLLSVFPFFHYPLYR